MQNTNYRHLLHLLSYRYKSIFFLQAIERAMKRLCEYDSNLILRKSGNERFCHFRVAHYLSSILENRTRGLYIDCEFNKDKNNNSKNNKKIIITKNNIHKKIRPDIIFHDRGNRHIFALEMKMNTIKEDKKSFLQMTEKKYIIAYKINCIMIMDFAFQKYLIINLLFIIYLSVFKMAKVRKSNIIIHT